MIGDGQTACQGRGFHADEINQPRQPFVALFANEEVPRWVVWPLQLGPDSGHVGREVAGFDERKVGTHTVEKFPAMRLVDQIIGRGDIKSVCPSFRPPFRSSTVWMPRLIAVGTG